MDLIKKQTSSLFQIIHQVKTPDFFYKSKFS